MTADLAKELKTCTCCFKEQPRSEFRRRYRDGEERHSICRQCYNRESCERRKAARRRQVCHYVSEVQAASRDRDRVVALTRELSRTLGGPQTIAELLKEVFELAKASGRAFTAFRVLNTIVDIGLVADELSRERWDKMSDLELEVDLWHHLVQAVRENPQLAVLAARQLGWTIIPLADNG